MQLQKAEAELAKRDASVVGIVVDGTGVNEGLRSRLSLTFPLLSDPDLKAIRAYGVEDVGNDIALPATVVIKQDGTVQWAYVGDRPSDRPLLGDVLAVLDG